MNTDDPSLRKRPIVYINKKLNNIIWPFAATYSAVNDFKRFATKFFKLLGAHIGLLIIVTFVLFGNFRSADAQASEGMDRVGNLAGFTPEAIGDIVATVSPYTPELNEDKDRIIYSMAMEADKDYLNTPFVFDTNITADEVNTNTPRTRVLTYIIQGGDTLSGIASKFNLRIDSLKYVNNITDIDNLKPGQYIKIPTADLSDAAIAKAKNSQSRQLASTSNRTTVVRSGSYPVNLSLIVPIPHNGISRGLTRYHHGIDYRASIGTPVRASASGKVIIVDGFGWNDGWGKTIVIDHGKSRTTRYAHLSQINVSTGQWVTQGQIIALSGNTGRSSGPHLHFQLDIYGRPVYPF